MTPVQAQLLLPLLLHAGWTVALYVLLTWARLVVVRRGEARKADFARADGDPPLSARIQRNLANQYEAPALAWAGAIVLILSDHIAGADIAAAWLFLAGRLVHSGVQILTDDVALRGKVFVINFLGVLWLIGHAAWAVLART